MTKIKSFILLIFLSIPAVLFGVSFFLPSEAVQGEVIKIIIWDSEPITGEFSAGINRGGREYSTGKGFDPFIFADDTLWVKLILIGIPSTMPLGECELKVSGADEDRTVPFSVESGEFIHEDIPLNTSMSNLRQSDDPEKANQWRILYGLLTTFNPENLYLDDAISLPLDPRTRRTSFYGDRRKFIYRDGNESSSIHYGIDFSDVPGTPIEAAGRGRVVFSGLRILSGETIVIEHLPGTYSLYYHMKERYLREGEIVAAGTHLGTIGATGLVTGAHLHWEIRVNGVPVSPDRLIGAPLVDKDWIISIIEGR